MREGIALTKASSGAAAAPALGAVIATLGTIPAGIYRVHVTVLNVGTQETTGAGFVNMALRKGSTTIASLPSTDKAVSQVFERVLVDQTAAGADQSLNVGAVAAAAAGSFYVASLSAVRIDG